MAGGTNTAAVIGPQLAQGADLGHVVGALIGVAAIHCLAHAPVGILGITPTAQPYGATVRAAEHVVPHTPLRDVALAGGALLWACGAARVAKLL